MKKHSLDARLEDLLEDGMTEKMARGLLMSADAESRSVLYEPDYVRWAHGLGFLAEHAYSYGLNDKTVGDYVSDYEFAKAWPLNSWARIWINDKLTTRLILSEPEFASVLPGHYWYTTSSGPVPLVDNRDFRGADTSAFLSSLERHGDFAAKPNNGAGAEGFCRLSCRDGEFSINGRRTPADGIRAFLAGHPNYVFTEFIRPAPDYAAISPLIHTLRVVVLNENGNAPRIVSSYIRFPNHSTDISNYRPFDGSSDADYHIYVEVNMETGEWGNGKIVYPTRTERLVNHPESGKPLFGLIADVDRLRELALGIATKLNLVEYMGFDFGITDKGFKLMEINSHPALATPQLFKPFNLDSVLRSYFSRKLSELDKLTNKQKEVRNGIRR